MLAVIAKILMSVGVISASRERGSCHILTTNNRTVDLDGRPNDSIAGGLTKHIG